MSTALTLSKIYMFNHLSDERLAEVEAALKRRELKSGEILFNMGDPGDELYVVLDGQVAIFAPDSESPGDEKPIRIFDKNDALGEMALIDRKPRSLSARALQPSVIMALGLADFQRFVNEDPAFSMSLMEGLSDRIRYTTDFLSEVKTWVSRVSQGDYNNPTFLNQVRTWMANIAEGKYEEAQGDGETSNSYSDETLSTLAAEFATMAAKVKQREEELKQQIVELKIAIDSKQREEEVKRVTATKNFEDLRAKARAMREEAQRFDES